MLGGSISTVRVRIGLANKFYVNFVQKKTLYVKRNATCSFNKGGS